jgi:periodic tryptophan protein 2
MAGHFKLQSLLGRGYTSGNVVFTPDGSTLLSPVGNRVVKMDVQR